MFALSHKIVIGGRIYNGVSEVKIKRSITSVSGTAVVSLPTSAVLKQTDGSSRNVLTAQMIKRGDKITIDLGYNGKLYREFTGYVTRVNYSQPIEVECEDAVFLLRSKKIKKSYKNTTLDAVLKDIFEGTGVKYDTGGLTIKIEKLLLASDAGGEVPREDAFSFVLDRYGLVAYSNTDETMFVGLRQGKRDKTVKYKLGWNTIKDNELKYHSSEDMKVKIKAVYINKLGARTEVEVGDDDGSARTIFLSDVADKAQMKKLAENELSKYKFDGYAGKVTAFLQPFAEPADVIEIKDDNYAQRSGNYYCEGVEVTFGKGGARRIIELGAKV